MLLEHNTDDTAQMQWILRRFQKRTIYFCFCSSFSKELLIRDPETAY